MADLVIVVAITNTEAKSAAHGISLFLVEEGMPGFKKGKKLKKIGAKAQVGQGHYSGQNLGQRLKPTEA